MASSSDTPPFIISRTRLTREGNFVSFGVEIPDFLNQPAQSEKKKTAERENRISDSKCGACKEKAKYRSKEGFFSCSVACFKLQKLEQLES